MGFTIQPDQITNYLQQMRDLTLLEINEEQRLVMACDSLGAIGNKPLDVVQATIETVAHFAVRVPLFEVIASGAKPLYVIDCLMVEMDGFGREYIAAIQSYCRKAGMLHPVQFNGSTEDNVPTSQTGVGIMVCGLIHKNRLCIGTSQSGDVMVCAGIPKSGPRYELKIDDPEIVSIEDIQFLRQQATVNDMVPVGSKGVSYEAKQLAMGANLSFIPSKKPPISFTDSGGPASCVLFSTAFEELERLSQQVEAPLSIVGRLEGKR